MKDVSSIIVATALLLTANSPTAAAEGDPAAPTAALNAHMSFAYPDLRSALGLTVEEERRLLDIIARRQRTGLSLANAIRANGRQAAETAFKPVLQEHQRELEELLGPDRYREWRPYGRTRAARITFHKVRALLPAEDAFDQDRYEAAVAALTDEWDRQRIERARLFEDSSRAGLSLTTGPIVTRQLELIDQHHQRSHDVLAPFLTPNQLSHFDRVNQAHNDSKREDIVSARDDAETGPLDGESGNKSVIYRLEPEESKPR